MQVMTELTDAVQGAKGKTVLYTPQDDLDDVQEVARDQASQGTLKHVYSARPWLGTCMWPKGWIEC